MTRDQFMSMSPQEKWDQYCLLESELNVAEGKLALLEAHDDENTVEVAPVIDPYKGALHGKLVRL